MGNGQVAFAVIAMGWVIWHMTCLHPRFLSHMTNESMIRPDHRYCTNARMFLPVMPGPVRRHHADFDRLGGPRCFIPVLAGGGNAQRRFVLHQMEYPDYTRFDYFCPVHRPRCRCCSSSSMTLVMLYEVFLRYVDRSANQMGQRADALDRRLRVPSAQASTRCSNAATSAYFILYDYPAETIAATHCDVTISVGSDRACSQRSSWFTGASSRSLLPSSLHRWEMFGTAFDPPIPATIQPMILIVAVLIADAIRRQSCCRLEQAAYRRWTPPPTIIDEEELEAIKKSDG